METIDFERLNYGIYQLEADTALVENTRYATAEFNRLYVRKVRIPDGKGNLIFLLSNTFAGGIKMIQDKQFIVPSTYRIMFYPQVITGTFLTRRYRKYINGDIKSDHNSMIKNDLKLRVYSNRTLRKTNDNMIVNLGDVYEAIAPIMKKKPLKQVYNNFWKELGRIIDNIGYPVDEKSYRVLIIDSDAFGWTGNKLEDVKDNPLYLLYIAYLRNRELTNMDVDIDMMICGNNMFMKFNPSKLDLKAWSIFRRGLFKIMKSDLDKFTDSLPEEEREEVQDTAKDKLLSTIVNDTVEPYMQNSSSAVRTEVQAKVEEKLRQEAAKKLLVDSEMKKAVKEKKPKDYSFDTFMNDRITTSQPGKRPLSPDQQKMFQQVAGSYEMLASDTGIEYDDDEDEYDDDRYDDENDEEEYDEDDAEILADDAQDILTNDDDVKNTILSAIQDQVEPKPSKNTNKTNSARDEKLREEQKKVVVKNSTIEELLSKESDNIPIEEDDKSKVMHTANKNMQHVKFANFEKTYIDKLMYKDIVACFDMLKDKENPFFITGIDIKDTSTALDLKETWTVSLKDQFGKRHTIKVDIPRFKDNKFMLINGTKYMILKQNFYKPLVKDTPDTVILTTNYNKVTITRRATKSLNTIERIFSLIKKVNNPKIFTTGDSTKTNMRYISTLEYDELSRNLFKFKSGGTEICFSRAWINDHWAEKIPDHRKDEFCIGFESGVPIFINEDTGADSNGRTITDIIVSKLPEDIQSIYAGIKGPSQSMYVEATLDHQTVPVIALLIVWNGIKKTLDLMGIEWEFLEGVKRAPAGSKSIRFANGILTYKHEVFAELILNGLSKMHPEQFAFEDFESEVGYEEYMHVVWGTYNGITEVKAFNELLVDPITKSVCNDINLPDTPSGLLIHAVKMLSDNAYVSKASDKSYRVRSLEVVSALLYKGIVTQYKTHIKSGRRIPFTLNQRYVMTKLKTAPGIEAYSTLNPVVEVNKTSTISSKGYMGTNKDRAYDESKRSYDPSSVGKIAISRSPDKNVGINNQLVVEPLISNARGYGEILPDEEDKDERNTELANLKDVNVFSPTEMLTPGTARRDDPIRTAINQCLPCIMKGDLICPPKLIQAVAVKPHICWKLLRACTTKV